MWPVVEIASLACSGVAVACGLANAVSLQRWMIHSIERMDALKARTQSLEASRINDAWSNQRERMAGRMSMVEASITRLEAWQAIEGRKAAPVEDAPVEDAK